MSRFAKSVGSAESRTGAVTCVVSLRVAAVVCTGVCSVAGCTNSSDVDRSQPAVVSSTSGETGVTLEVERTGSNSLRACASSARAWGDLVIRLRGADASEWDASRPIVLDGFRERRCSSFPLLEPARRYTVAVFDDDAPGAPALVEVSVVTPPMARAGFVAPRSAVFMEGVPVLIESGGTQPWAEPQRIELVPSGGEDRSFTVLPAEPDALGPTFTIPAHLFDDASPSYPPESRYF